MLYKAVESACTLHELKTKNLENAVKQYKTRCKHSLNPQTKLPRYKKHIALFPSSKIDKNVLSSSVEVRQNPENLSNFSIK